MAALKTYNSDQKKARMFTLTAIKYCAGGPQQCNKERKGSKSIQLEEK